MNYISRKISEIFKLDYVVSKLKFDFNIMNTTILLAVITIAYIVLSPIYNLFKKMSNNNELKSSSSTFMKRKYRKINSQSCSACVSTKSTKSTSTSSTSSTSTTSTTSSKFTKSTKQIKPKKIYKTTNKTKKIKKYKISKKVKKDLKNILENNF